MNYTLGGVTNPAAGTYAAGGFTVRTSRDTSTTSAASAIAIAPATAVTGVTLAEPTGDTVSIAFSDVTLK